LVGRNERYDGALPTPQLLGQEVDMATLRHFSCLLGGVFVGAIGCSILRVMQYKLNDWQPNVAPEMFVVLAPVLALPIALIALAAHFAIRATYAYRQDSHWVLAGIAYSTIYLLLITPWLLPMVALAYFFAIRKIDRVSAKA
jgi:hypothetical protein